MSANERRPGLITLLGSCVVVAVVLSLAVNRILETENTTQPSVVAHSSDLPPNYRDLTIVTAFFDIGTFSKKWQWRHRDKNVYHSWMSGWAYVENRVYAYFESSESADIFAKVRSSLPPEKTIIRLVNRYELFGYKYLENVTKVYSDPTYPDIHPDTTVPEYPCVTNTRYDVVQKAALEKSSAYYGWLDIGTFKYHLRRLYKPFTITMPNGADISKIIYADIDSLDLTLTVSEVFKTRAMWMGGGAFMGTGENMILWSKLYQQAFVTYLKQGLACNDQTVLYAMILPEKNGGLNLGSRVQVYPRLKGHDRGFEVVYLFESSWRYPIVMCTAQIDKKLRETCLGM